MPLILGSQTISAKFLLHTFHVGRSVDRIRKGIDDRLEACSDLPSNSVAPNGVFGLFLHMLLAVWWGRTAGFTLKMSNHNILCSFMGPGHVLAWVKSMNIISGRSDVHTPPNALPVVVWCITPCSHDIYI